MPVDTITGSTIADFILYFILLVLFMYGIKRIEK